MSEERPERADAADLLRPATVDDVMTLGFLELELFPDEAWTVFQLAEEIEHPDRRYVVAEEDGEIIGYAGAMIAGDLADIHTIGTTAPGRGIGRALLGWLHEQSRAAGAARMMLEVREDNARARAFYRRAGYETIGRRPGYYRTPRGPLDAIVMERGLTGTSGRFGTDPDSGDPGPGRPLRGSADR